MSPSPAASALPVLVVGGTGVLRDVVAPLTRSAQVVVASRRPGGRAGRGRVLVADTARPSAAPPGRWRAAVLYAPAVHPDVVRRIVRSTRGAVVLVIPSAMLAADEAAVRRLVAATGAVPVLLGWAGAPDAPRWHTHAEIATAALTGLRDRRPVSLGRFTGRRPD